eukprot:401474-Rhodomonas_salina.1
MRRTVPANRWRGRGTERQCTWRRPRDLSLVAPYAHQYRTRRSGCVGPSRHVWYSQTRRQRSRCMRLYWQAHREGKEPVPFAAIQRATGTGAYAPSVPEIA